MNSQTTRPGSTAAAPAAVPHGQRGIAAITAILAVALATMIAVDLLWRTHLDLRRAQGTLAAEQSWLYLRGAEALATLALSAVDAQDAHHLGQAWAQPLADLAVTGGQLSGVLEDLQGRFNLNNLIAANGAVDPVALAWFERLLRILELEPGLAGAVADWIDADAQPQFPIGAEDDVYTRRDPPYRPPNKPMTSASELLAVDGISPEMYRILRPFVTALPVGTVLNVHTASAELLASLDDTFTLAEAQTLVASRGAAPFADYQNLFASRISAEMQRRIGVRSAYFGLSLQVQLLDQEWFLYSLLRSGDNGAVHPLFRSMGAD